MVPTFEVSNEFVKKLPKIEKSLSLIVSCCDMVNSEIKCLHHVWIFLNNLEHHKTNSFTKFPNLNAHACPLHCTTSNYCLLIMNVIICDKRHVHLWLTTIVINTHLRLWYNYYVFYSKTKPHILQCSISREGWAGRMIAC